MLQERRPKDADKRREKRKLALSTIWTTDANFKKTYHALLMWGANAPHLWEGGEIIIFYCVSVGQRKGKKECSDTALRA